MMAMPWQFWTQMQMHHPVRIAPVLAMYALIGTFVVAVSVAAGDPVIRSYFGWFRGIEFTILTGQFKIYPRHVTVPLICIAALMPLGFVALPVSRKTAKVQWRHILRITAYSFAPLALLVLFERLLALAVDQFGYQPWLKWTPPMIKMLRFAIVPLFLVLWWGFGINQYLKMRHGLGIAVAMFSMAALGFALSMAVGTMIDDV